MKHSKLTHLLLALASICLSWAVVGCLSVKAPEEISIGNSYRPKPIDASHVPATRDHEEARQKLAEAYEHIRYLQEEVKDLESDKEELKDELKEMERAKDSIEEKMEEVEEQRDDYKEKYEDERDRNG